VVPAFLIKTNNMRYILLFIIVWILLIVAPLIMAITLNPIFLLLYLLFEQGVSLGIYLIVSISKILKKK